VPGDLHHRVVVKALLDLAAMADVLQRPDWNDAPIKGGVCSSFAISATAPSVSPCAALMATSSGTN
jgi:hypothetical protein